MVLALSIVASMTVIVWGSIAVSFESRQYMMNSFDQHQQVRLAVDRMSREFSMAFITVHANKKDHIPTTLLGGTQRHKELGMHASPLYSKLTAL